MIDILTNLYRRALTDFRERGLHILHFAAGVLEWRDSDDQPMRSPLVLLPVELRRQSLQEPFILAPSEDDPYVNPALQVRLKQDFDFRLPEAPEDWEEDALAKYWTQVEELIRGLPGWKVDRAGLLSLFAFFKGVIYQDLDENAERVKACAGVQRLAGLPTALSKANLPLERDLDDRQNLDQTFHILDADGSQHLALEAARQGESFVLIGPPGTGKSQTIANLIADHIARGKKVLFVSEKMAALEVVYQRLRKVGLGDFCLELHSHKANKREVVTELARCFQEQQKASGSGSWTAEQIESLKHRRDQLNRYLRALHALREPMRRSAWDVLAELPRWQNLQALPLGLVPPAQTAAAATTAATDPSLARRASEPSPAPRVSAPAKTDDAPTILEITAAQFDDLKQMLHRLQQLWHIRADRSFMWRGFKADRYNLQLRDEVVSLIDKIRARLDKVKSAAGSYAGKLGVHGPALWLLKVGELLDARPPGVFAAWLGEPNLDALSADLEKCAEQYQRLGQARAPLTTRYGPALWSMLEGGPPTPSPPQGRGEISAKVADAWKNSAKWLHPGDDNGAAMLAAQQKLRGWAAETIKKLPTWSADLRVLEKWLAVTIPTGAGAATQARRASEGSESRRASETGEARLDPSPHHVKQYLRLAHLCMTDYQPEREWVNGAPALKEAQDLIALSKPVFATYHERRKRLLQSYTDEFFELELERIALGYAGPYQSWFRMFNGTYRRDKRALKRRCRTEWLPDTVAEDVALGAALLKEKARFEQDQPKRRTVLGRYERGLDTDWDKADKATKTAVEAIAIARELGSNELPPRLVDALSATAAPQDKIRAAVKRLDESFAAWHRLTLELKHVLPMDQVPAVAEPLDECALSALVQFAKELQNSLNAFGALTDSLLAQAPAAPPDLATLVADLRQAEELRAFEATQETEAAQWSTRLGPGFRRLATDWNALRKTLTWVRKLRGAFEEIKTPLGAGFVELATAPAAPPPVKDLKQAQEQYEQVLHQFEHRFDAPGPRWSGQPLGQLPLEQAEKHWILLRDKTGELADWIDFRHLPDRFGHLGLADFWERMQENPPPREQVVDVFLKSFWSAWVEAVFEKDAALGGFRRADHERVLEEFRALDRQFIDAGAGRVEILARRSSEGGTEDEVTLLMKEAHKKTKHWPLRRLFDAMPRLLSRIKPCLLMSPLSVSQFLPADAAKLHFDVVVFDEASQIVPEDAVGAIYRGRQVVIAGDNRQLPPTTFFQQLADEGDDEADEELAPYESILDTGLAAGLPQRLLRWHYRSRHEHLIAFSNERFYEGKLITFPAAVRTSPELGVYFHHVPDGVYDRGGKRDNPREAQVVADLVLDHFRKHPDKTLGVIAFSYPQMDAIEDELERRLRRHPDLEKFFGEDRMEGFFIKNLETVQGDERDVIFLSVGYGKDASGKLVLNFGPLNRESGARRLNVAVTRARKKLIVISSIKAADIARAGPPPDSVAHLHHYLDFAERGLGALKPKGAEKPAVQPALGDDIAAVLRDLGYQAAPNVGCGPLRIDLGVVHPKQPESFLLGIEFDGPGYAHAGTARDRDRLRPAMLEQLGWKLHRLWAPDWLERRQEEIERLKVTLQGVTG
ncbi:MAG: DUF4011 domain-containing protein [Gemmataceae bacterium]|nr:DUF4011 domain-containing protein [Gemmataceae bacterium]